MKQPDETLSRNQERFLQALMVGKSIPDASKEAGISRITGWRWSQDSTFQAERKRREAELSKLEQEEITRILTSGYALMHKRVEALNELANILQEEALDPSKRWLPDVKTVGFGPDAERVDLVQFNADLIKEFRATFADLASELGQRVKKQEIEHSGLVELLNAEHASLLSDIEAIPDNASLVEIESEDSNT